MTGPAIGGSERGAGTQSRSTGMQGAVGAVLFVLALGFALRLIIAYLLPGSGFQVDLNAFRFWANWLAEHGPGQFYAQDFFHDYTPGYLYVLWAVGVAGKALGGIGDLIKIPPILADLAVGWLVWSMVRELGGRTQLALLGAAVAVLNPISWFDSVVWGQVDSVGVVFLLLALRALWRDQPERAAIFTVIAGIIKPQLGVILVPIVAAVTIRRALWPVAREAPPPDDDAGGVERGDDGTDEVTDDGGQPRSILGRARAWERRTGHPSRILTTGIAAYLAAQLISLPFGLWVVQPTASPPFVTSGLVRQVIVAGASYPYLTVNAYNPWALVSGDTGHSLAADGLWVCDAPGVTVDQCGSGVAMFGVVPAIVVGAALLLGAIALVVWVVARNPDRLTLLVALAVLSLAFFVLPTRVHERYGFPFFALGAILVALSARWRVAYVVLSLATFANMYVVLTTIYANNPSISDWLGLGSTLRGPQAVALTSIVHGMVFLWAFVQLRGDGRMRLEDEAWAVSDGASGSDAWEEVQQDEIPEDEIPHHEAPLEGMPALPAVTVAALGTPEASDAGVGVMPPWSGRGSGAELGFVGWFRERLMERPVRPDRTAVLARERGGRLDRLDLWLLVVLVLAAMFLRTFRLAEPYQMHFDEVYHARTATEFLQGWRYQLPHNIYEWTHPHLAKYLMAAGIVVWGQDDVEATSDLGVPIESVAIEPRHEDPLTGDPAGERIHVATGTEVRTYDLRTRALVAVEAAPGATAVEVDLTSDRLIIGSSDGAIETLDLAVIGLGGVDDGLEPEPLGRVDHPVDHLLATDEGATLLAASEDRLTALDAASGAVTGTTELRGIADLAPGGTGAAIVAHAGEVEDPASVASTLAELVGGEPSDFEDRLAADVPPDEQIVLGNPGDSETRKGVEEAIADGRLAGVEIVDLPRVAVATADGVVFIDPMTAGTSSMIASTGGAHGLALLTGIDDPTLYVTTGTEAAPKYERIAVGGDSASSGPVSLGQQPLPGLGSLVAYDEASQQIHILGRAAGAAGAEGNRSTVYVIEPHGESAVDTAVYADALLPVGMQPADWAMDADAQYMTDDREDLLVFGRNGLTASIDVGSHAFAWRLPGVIAGALTAACLYLLARILFRRRLIAGLVGAFVLLDGMFFVQSRIGMNDVYVGLFLVAAYTVFAAVWTGWWRGRASFWVAMPIIGILLGLALATKWVAAYAIGALVLLLLIRSALGRVVAILGLIGLTTALGYIAISVPEGEGFGNITFLLIMIGLTLLAVVVSILHPIAWSDEEMRFAVVAPTALGGAVFLGALALGRLDETIVIGSISVTPLLAAIALTAGSVVVYGLFQAAGSIGFGPLARSPGPGDPVRLLDPPDPAPEGWLRPGWLAGLPVVWAGVALLVIPLVVYVISYVPWTAIEGHQLWPGVPAGNTGQTLAELTAQMYGYHNGLASPHPASSPWWAWPLDLKPVWFYQHGFAAGTSAAIYNAGNLVIWWVGAAALVFVSIMAFRRRSLALALIAIGFAAQWVPWARIDRAAFQYHYYTALPFIALSLAYVVAELWHGPSRRTWAAMRLAGAVALVGPAVMWLLSRPLCAVVGVTNVNPGSQACPAVIPDAVITVRTVALLALVAIGAFVLSRVLLALARESEDGTDPGSGRAFRELIVSAIAISVALVLASLLPETPIYTATNVPVEPIALLVGIPLAYFAITVIAARDARRYVVGLGVAVAAWFAIVYPNISALPLPSAVVNAYQGLLPTYLYAFQFPVSTVSRNVVAPLLSPAVALLGVALTLTCLVVAYSTWVWRLAAAESNAARGSGASGDAAADGLARTGEGA